MKAAWIIINFGAGPLEPEASACPACLHGEGRGRQACPVSLPREPTWWCLLKGGVGVVADMVGGVEGVEHGSVALLARRLLGVQRHLGTLDDNVVDLKLFPPGAEKSHKEFYF